METLYTDALTYDEKTSKDVQRRRLESAARLKRQSDVHSLHMSLDLPSLSRQVQDARLKKEENQLENQQWDQQALYFGSMQELQRQERQRIAFENEKSTKEYSLMHLKKIDRREYDLSDIDSLKHSYWIKKGTEFNVPISSLLEFEGEDGEAGERRIRQQRQQREAIQQHLFETMLKHADQHKEEKEMHEKYLRNSRFADGTHTQIMETMAKQRINMKEANKLLAERAKNNTLRNKELIAAVERLELEQNIHSVLLTEGRVDMITGDTTIDRRMLRAPIGVLAGNRDGFKGASLEAHKKAKDINDAIQKQTKIAILAAKQESIQHDVQNESKRRLQVAIDREQQLRYRTACKEISAANVLLQHQHHQQETNDNQVLSKRKIEESYFNYFGSSSR